MKPLVSVPRALMHDEAGSIAVEFALIAPVVLLILAGIIDIGSAASIRLGLDARVTAAADYALLQPAPADAAAAEAMAATLVGLLQGGTSDTAGVVVNNAASAEWTDTGTVVTAGPGTPGMCYCPTLSQGAVVWGSATSCGSPCAGGESAGQYVGMSASARYVAIFPWAVMGEGNTVQAQSVVRLQ